MSTNSQEPMIQPHLESKLDTKSSLEPEIPTHPNQHGQVEERWITLCAQAAVEEDPKKLLELVSEINRLLDARKKRLANERERMSDRNK